MAFFIHDITIRGFVFIVHPIVTLVEHLRRVILIETLA